MCMGNTISCITPDRRLVVSERRRGLGWQDNEITGPGDTGREDSVVEAPDQRTGIWSSVGAKLHYRRLNKYIYCGCSIEKSYYYRIRWSNDTFNNCGSPGTCFVTMRHCQFSNHQNTYGISCCSRWKILQLCTARLVAIQLHVQQRRAGRVGARGGLYFVIRWKANALILLRFDHANPVALHTTLEYCSKRRNHAKVIVDFHFMTTLSNKIGMW